MRSANSSYLYLLFRKTILPVVLVSGFTSLAHAQNKPAEKASSIHHLSPLLLSAPGKSIKPASDLNQYFKRPGNQLMNWPDYPLTAAQIMERDKKYDQPIGQQLASSIAESYINSILDGKNKKPVASVPKF
ncbi:MAG: hypothetical protein IPJ02_03255 [Chitinophagaceae bacterium]|nr:hypothetical protein [Chitinophagaceae bacterium]